MRNTPSPHILNSPKTKQSSCSSFAQHGQSTRRRNRGTSKTIPLFSYIKIAANKVAGVFTILFLPRNKPTAALIDATKSNFQDRRICLSSDLSAASTSSNSKNSSRLKSSSSYSSYSATSGQVGSVTFSFEELYKATDKFSPANIIGDGSFATVYQGKLKDGSVVAVKRARKNMSERPSLSEFKNEVLTLSQIEHFGLVRLYGYLEHGDEKLIVVEYVSNGTLREHLDGKLGSGLEIGERLDIAIDVAHAITYLHIYTDPPIIHRDVKASNILITEKLRAKVADFGFARSSTEDAGVTHISTQVKGTTGYLDPEYLRTYQLTEKSDVYSFGVLLVEMMTGRHPIELKRPIEERVTSKWAMQKVKAGDAIMVMDPLLRRSPASIMAVEKVLKLARRCLAPTRQSRPSMRECGEVLWRIRKNFREALASSSPSTSHQSSDFPYRDAKESRMTTFGIKDGESYKFISA